MAWRGPGLDGWLGDWLAGRLGDWMRTGGWQVGLDGGLAWLAGWLGWGMAWLAWWGLAGGAWRQVGRLVGFVGIADRKV